MLNDDDVLFIKAIFPFYEKLTKQEKFILTVNTVQAIYKKDKIILNNENECNGVVILKSGQLRAYIDSDEGKEITLYRLLSNDVCIMTASCILKNINFTVTLEVEKDSLLYFIPANIWSDLSSSNGYIKEYESELISERFSEVMWVMEQVVFKGMGNRLAEFLLEQSALQESDSITITHETIAKNLGTAREVISRMLKYFEIEGLIEMSRGTVKIINNKKLIGMSNS
jgi:CRP/FNR family transcriptional regulator